MADQLYLLGAGGHGRVVLDALLAANTEVTGILDPRITSGERIFGVTVRGADDILDEVDPRATCLANGIGANPRVDDRRSLFDKYTSRGFSFDPVIHPSAIIGAECRIEAGAQIMAGVVLQNRVRIAPNAVVNTGVCVDHDCIVGSHSFVSPGAILTGNVVVGDGAFIGAGATILPGVRIGSSAVVGAGAMVMRSIADGVTVVGNPAR